MTSAGKYGYLSPILPHELQELYRLARSIWLPSFAPLFSEKELVALYNGMYNDATLLSWMGSAGNHLFFICMQADAKSRRIGYLGISIQAPLLYIDKIYVHPDQQGRGIGLAVMEEAERRGQNAGCTSSQLRVNRGNKKAIKFYESMGYQIEKEIDLPAPSGYTYSDFVMCKALC